MLKYYYIGSTTLALLPPLNLTSTTVSSNDDNSSVCTAASNRFSVNRALMKLGARRVSSNRCRASRRRVLRYNDDDEDEEDEEYGYNAEIAMLEIYSQSARDEALMVRALVDEEEAEVLIFRVSFCCYWSFNFLFSRGIQLIWISEMNMATSTLRLIRFIVTSHVYRPSNLLEFV